MLASGCQKQNKWETHVTASKLMLAVRCTSYGAVSCESELILLTTLQCKNAIKSIKSVYKMSSWHPLRQERETQTNPYNHFSTQRIPFCQVVFYMTSFGFIWSDIGKLRPTPQSTLLTQVTALSCGKLSTFLRHLVIPYWGGMLWTMEVNGEKVNDNFNIRL